MEIYNSQNSSQVVSEDIGSKSTEKTPLLGSSKIREKKLLLEKKRKQYGWLIWKFRFGMAGAVSGTGAVGVLFILLSTYFLNHKSLAVVVHHSTLVPNIVALVSLAVIIPVLLIIAFAARKIHDIAEKKSLREIEELKAEIRGPGYLPNIV